MQIQEPGSILAPVSDALLARVALAGDQKAFAMLIQRHHIAMFNFIYRFLGDYQRACDIFQETCLRIYHALSNTRKDESFLVWFLRMTYCSCIDKLRCTSRETCGLSQSYGGLREDEAVVTDDMPGNISDLFPLSANILARPDLEQLLQHVIILLPPKLRAAIILHSVLLLSFEEIGQILTMPASAAQTCCEQAKLLIRRYVREKQKMTIFFTENM